MAACYTPALPSDVPCSPNGACPEGQTCSAGVCVALTGSLHPDAARPGDAGGDAVLAGDSDHDGVPDDVDNCPDVANPDQANEDGDRFGDACDPCPPVANDTPSDPDGDGVADSCDPNPMTPGDKIEVFEGFHHGLPPWARTPNWVVVGDAVRATAAANTSEYLIPPVANPNHVTVSASFVVESEVANTNSHDVDVGVPNDVGTDSSVSCELFQPAGASGRDISLFDDFAPKELTRQALAWTNNTAYTVSMVRRDTSYVCNILDPSGTRSGVSGTSSSSTAQPTVIVRAYAVTARVNWVMVVRSP